ncbi:MAG: lysoplasmalogenase [Spirochaetaceae bacterium]|jgi:uncharacterized membrane protein YhhN|nr:lysoplasmalogenase [Spirochaetaceae bacterium]
MIFMALYFAAAFVNICSILAGKKTARIISKCCLMPLLAAYYLMLTLNTSGDAAPFQIFVIIALFFAWAGDAALAVSGRQNLFFAGLGSFLIGHIFYILQFFTYTSLSTFSIITLCILLAAEAVIIIVMQFSRVYIIPFVIYGFALALMAALALSVCLKQAAAAPFARAFAAGGLLFFASDIVLGAFAAHPKNKYRDVFIMITYIAAQFCIVLGAANVSY